MDPQQEHTWPSFEQFGSDKRDLADEAMYRSLKAKLFDEAYAPVQIGRFRVLQTLGQGGMGVVYSAQDLQLDRLVAIKVIRDDRLREGARDRARLLREAQMQAKLSHPNVVQIHEVSESEGGLFIVMELVKGCTLREWLDREPRPLAAILERFVEAARGLSAAHRVGIVHRDFKLANAMVGEDGRVRIADFGLAVADQSQQETEPDRTAGPASGHTSKFAGTPTYMSPEQVRGRECDARSDQYSFAVALTEAVFRRPPPPAVERLADKAPPLTLPADPPAPQWLRKALGRALSLDPADRYPSMASLIDVLVESPRRRRRRALAAGLVAALAGAAALGAVLVPESPQSQCSQADNSLGSLWNDDRRQTLRASFTGTELPYAENSGQRTIAALDKYADDWAAVAHESCLTSRPPGHPSEQMFQRSAACLDDRRVAFATLIDALITSDITVVPDSEALVDGLPPLAECRLINFLNAEGPVERTDPAVRELLERGLLLTRMERGQAAVALLSDALPRIASTGDLGAEAEARLLLGRAQGRLLRDGPNALRSLHSAYDSATTAKRAALKWQIWNELAHVHAVLFDAPVEARRDLAHARSSRPLDSQDADTALRDVESAILIAEDRAAEAVEQRRASLAALQARHPAGHPEVVKARESLAAALGDAAQPEEARAQHAQLLDELRKEYGPDHPYTARVELNLGLDLLDLERFDDARKHFEHARAALIRTYGEIHLLVAKAELALAHLDLGAGETAPAVAWAERAVAAYEALVPRTHSERVVALFTLSDAYTMEGRLDRVLAVNRELLRIHEADPTRKDIDVPGILTNIGETLCMLDQCADAAPTFMRLMMLYQNETPPEPAMQAIPLRGIGLANLRTGKPDLALPFLEQALKLLEQSPHERDGMTDNLAATLRDVADALTALRRAPRRARELRRRAAELESTE